MTSDNNTKNLLIEIRDNQVLALQRQAEQLEIAREQLERARTQVAESIALQKQAMAKVRVLFSIALPLSLVCIALVIYVVYLIATEL